MTNPIYRGVLAVALLAGAACSPTPPIKPLHYTTFYVVRHAEKVNMTDDAPLSSAGHARAEALRDHLAPVRLAAIYATSYQRTQQTVHPTAAARKLPVTNTTPSVTELWRRHKGEAVLIAGHSNTVPQLLADLGVPTPITIGPRDYGDLFEVILPGSPDSGGTQLRRARFGEP